MVVKMNMKYLINIIPLIVLVKGGLVLSLNITTTKENIFQLYLRKEHVEYSSLEGTTSIQIVKKIRCLMIY